MKKKIILALSIFVVAAAALFGVLYYNGYLDMDTYEYDSTAYKFEDEWVYSVERIGSILSCKNLNYSGLNTDREEFVSEIFLQDCGVDYIGE